MKIVLLHGYSGGPWDFVHLTEDLRKQGHSVDAPLLLGHGTSPEELVEYELDDIFKDIDSRVGQADIIIGYSFGSHLAVLLHKKARGLLLINTPYKMNPPFSIPGAKYYAALRKLHPKRGPRPPIENDKAYRYIPGKALRITVEANAQVERVAGNVHIPVLAISSEDDFLVAKDAHILLAKLFESGSSMTLTTTNGLHNPFLPPADKEVLAAINTLIETTEQE